MRGLVAFNLWQTESLLWFCDRCGRLLHRVTMHVADIERELKAAIEHFGRLP